MNKHLCAFVLGSLFVMPALAQQLPLIAPAPLTVPVPSYAVIPSYATSSGNLSPSSKWFWTHDSGTPGSSVGSSQFPVVNPSLDNQSREFYVSYSQKAGERYSLDFGNDTAATHFVYDVHIYVVDPTQLANMEMDINQVTADDMTITFGFQCSAYSGTWEYSMVSGGHSHWHPTTIACNPEKWQANIWHHVRIGSHRSGNTITYDWVYMDGVYSQIKNATGLGAQALHWGLGSLNLNFQIDGAYANSGSVKLYQDELTVSRW